MSLNIKLHPKQYEVAVDTHRFRVINAGRRFGKSVLARSIVLDWATKNAGLYWIVSPTYQMARDIHWKQGYNLEIPQEWIAKKNEVDLEITLKNGSRIALKSAENPDRLRGTGLRGLVVDEVAFLKDWKHLWDEALRPALTDYQAPALFTSTPKGYNAFYELWMQGQKEDGEWKSWRITTYDNPFIPVEEIEQAKQELDEDTFAQEYLAEFKKFTGLVYKDFSRENNVIEPIELQPNWTYYRGIDFGFANPTAVIFAAITDKGELIIWDEIYQSGLQTPDLAQLIKQKSEGKTFVNTIADSAQMADIEELRRYGLMVNPVSKTSGSKEEDWATFRIRKVAEKLRSGTIKIFNNCQNLVFEFENYQYHEVRDGSQVREVPLKVNDHLLDALSYLVCSLPEKITPTYENRSISGFIEQLPKENYFTKEGFY
jgi:PBSX family phage terminase large subunit